MLDILFNPITFFAIAAVLFLLTLRSRFANRIGKKSSMASVTLNQDASQADLFELLQYLLREVDLSSKASSISVTSYPSVEGGLVRLGMPVYILQSIVSSREDLMRCVQTVNSSPALRAPSLNQFTRVSIESSNINSLAEHTSKTKGVLDPNLSINLELSKLDIHGLKQNNLTTARLWVNPDSEITPIVFDISNVSRLSVVHEIIQSSRAKKNSEDQAPGPVTAETLGINLGQIILFASSRQPDDSAINFGIKRSDKDQGLIIVSDDSAMSADILLMNIITDIHHSLPVLCISRQPGLVDRIIDHIPQERLDDIVWWSDTKVFGFGSKLAMDNMDRTTVEQLVSSGFNQSLIDSSQHSGRLVPINTVASYVRSPIIIVDASDTAFDSGYAILSWISSQLADSIHRLDLAQNTQVYCAASSPGPHPESYQWLKPLEIIAHKVYGASITVSMDYSDFDNNGNLISAQANIYGPRRTTASTPHGITELDSQDLHALHDGELLLKGGVDKQVSVKGRVLQIN